MEEIIIFKSIVFFRYKKELYIYELLWLKFKLDKNFIIVVGRGVGIKFYI